MNDEQRKLHNNLSEEDRKKFNKKQSQRAYYKGRMTHFRNELEKDEVRSYIGILETIKDELNKAQHEFNRIQGEIESEFMEIELAGQEREDFDNRFYEVMALVRQSLTSISTPARQTVPVNHGGRKARLAKLEPPKFNGEIKNWISFRKSFQIYVDSDELDEMGKFQYLEMSCRDGKAQHLLEASNSDFETAWSSLISHYDNDVLLKNQLITDLYDITPPKPKDSKSLQYFIDHAELAIARLKSIDIDPYTWDIFLVHHLNTRIDKESQKELERTKDQSKILTVTEFFKFLKARVQILDNLAKFEPSSYSTPKVDYKTSLKIDPRTVKKSFTSTETIIASAGTSERKCRLCNQSDHLVFECKLIKSISCEERKKVLREKELCFNCLRKNHMVSECQNPSRCKTCNGKHHTIIHPTTPQTVMNSIDKPSTSKDIQVTLAASQSTPLEIDVILATAIILVEDQHGMKIPARAFLDSGSTSSFMTEHFASKLKLTKTTSQAFICGINGQESVCKFMTSSVIHSRVSSYYANVDFLISRKIVADLPVRKVAMESLQIPANTTLADPTYAMPAKVDVLLGGGIFWNVVHGTRIQLSSNLWLHSSEFGSLVGGEVESKRTVVLASISDLKQAIQKFWEVETLNPRQAFSLEEIAAENHYTQNVRHLESKHYEVALPLKENISKLGNSAERAKRCFIASESRRKRDENRCIAYREFMQEMIDLGHMEEVTDHVSTPHFYMSHHIISRPSSTTTKYRVVFNASMNTNTGISLNDTLMVGPTIQPEVFCHLLRWREYGIAFTADIAKMYRQVAIRPEDRDFLRIWWRPNNNESLKSFRLTTVTYGTASAPFQAIRTLKQVAMDHVSTYSEVASCFEENFYVDDLIKSVPSPEEAVTRKTQLIALAAEGGFELRKWNSNLETLNDPESDVITNVLGVQWNKHADTIQVQFHVKFHPQVTRSSILSEIAQLFHPLGLCAPVILRAKIFMQQLWTLSHCDWDDLLPDTFTDKWIEFRIQSVSNESFDLHGFADASEAGFGACVYIVSNTSRPLSNLICAKSRVAPIKKLTIPRLELNAALLLAFLMDRVSKSLNSKPKTTYLWTDSEITLYRILDAPSKYTQYVGVRIAEIQQLSNIGDWRHIPTHLNPADWVSRGSTLAELADLSIWWHGPPFLLESHEVWPSQEKFRKFEIKPTPELEYSKKFITATSTNTPYIVVSRFSSYNHLLNVSSHQMRFFLNTKKARKYRITGPITLQERQEIEIRLIREVQKTYFQEELEQFRVKNSVPRGNKLQHLNPFIDVDGLIRVGGRLSHAHIPYNSQHQIIIPKSDYAILLLRHLHHKNLHCGPQTLFGTSRQKFWILGGRNLSRKIVHDCVVCVRQRPKLLKQIMGDVNIHRSLPSSPFKVCGIDYAGPFMIRTMPRTKILTKAYVALFTCFATRCTHLEIVMDLSTNSFLAALKRFVSRRGIPTTIYSDNATNFIGGRNQLIELKNLFLSQQHERKVKDYCTIEGIDWLTIPPRSPHWGGLWESIVKQMKYHLVRATRNEIMTYETLTTIIAQVESVLNSRPLTVLPSDNDEFNAITPGHFLIGRPLNAIPEPNYNDLPYNRLDLWQQRQVIVAELWKYFRGLYLMELQTRKKWRTEQQNIELDTIVVIAEDNAPPCNWKLGRIIEVHPGPDGKIRTATVKTADGKYVRPITKLGPLPIEKVH